MTNPHNKIQIFGLQRSGTNLMEWMLVHNFKLEYKNIYVPGNIPAYIKHEKRQALKHNFPSLQYSDYAIVILKPFDQWVESMKRYGKGKFATQDIWCMYADSVFQLPMDKVALVSHAWVDNHYENTLNTIASKFNLTIHNTERPKHRLSREGANTKETNELYIPNY